MCYLGQVLLSRDRGEPGGRSGSTHGRSMRSRICMGRKCTYIGPDAQIKKLEFPVPAFTLVRAWQRIDFRLVSNLLRASSL